MPSTIRNEARRHGFIAGCVVSLLGIIFSARCCPNVLRWLMPEPEGQESKQTVKLSLVDKVNAAHDELKQMIHGFLDDDKQFLEGVDNQVILDWCNIQPVTGFFKSQLDFFIAASGFLGYLDQSHLIRYIQNNNELSDEMTSMKDNVRVQVKTLFEANLQLAYYKQLTEQANHISNDECFATLSIGQKEYLIDQLKHCSDKTYGEYFSVYLHRPERSPAPEGYEREIAQIPYALCKNLLESVNNSRGENARTVFAAVENYQALIFARQDADNNKLRLSHG